MRKFILFANILLFISCGSTYVESIVTPQGSVLEVDGARFEIPAGSIAESILVEIEKKTVSKRKYEQGFNLVGTSFVIRPETLFFERPIQFSLSVMTQNAALGAKIGNGFVPIAGSKVEGETLRAKIWHGGEYYLISEPEQYGIKDHSDIEEAMLIVSDIYVSDYIKNFKQSLRAGAYDFPVWTFVYSNEKSIEENANFLADELEVLHEQYGNFRLDIVSFGVGGLITHRYIVDTLTYQRDISPVVIAVGTPFFGSSFADIEKVKRGKSPYRFFFLDGLGEKASDIALESDFISWLKKHKRLRGGWLKEPKEDKNPASIRAKKVWAGEFPEENDGDGLISLAATMLTPIEPDPFNLGHFELFESSDVHEVVVDFVQLYRSFAWMDFFLKVWEEDEPFSKISELWEREIKLHYRNMIDFEILLEWNENMLKSAPKDAILITNGDNDTYPAWYLQEKGVRNDVLVVNRNLFNTTGYILYQQKKGLPLDIPPEKIDSLRPYKDKETGEIVWISDYLIGKLLEQKKRPVVFSTTVYKPERYGYPLMLSGVVYEIGEGNIEINGKYINIERTLELFHEVFCYDKLFSVPFDSLTEDIQYIYSNHAASLHTLSLALEEQEYYEEALKEIQFAQQFTREKMRYFFYYNEALMYSKMDKKDKADSVFKKLLEMPNPNVDLKMKKQISRNYYGMDMKEEAIRILAECLKENPGDKEILELIKQYQEDL